MKQRFILLICLLIVISLQANLFAGCGCGKKKNPYRVQGVQKALFHGGCGCGGGGGASGSEDIPPDTEE